MCPACEEAENRDLEERLEEARSAAAATHNELTTAQVAIEGFKTQIIQLKVRSEVWFTCYVILIP